MKFPTFRIINRDCEHSAELCEYGGTYFLKSVHDDLRVRMTLERVSFQPLSQFMKIVDLPVKNDPDCAVLIAHRLSTGFGKIDYRETTMRHACPATDPDATAVRPAMRERT